MSDFDEKARNFYMEYYKNNLRPEGKKLIYSHAGKDIEVAGDVCFNLKFKNGKNHTLYSSIIKDDKEIDRLYSLLDEIRYSPMNISIMPRKGGLNNIKNAIGNNRFDTFARLLSIYYDGDKVPIINGGAVNMYIEQRLSLERFLDSYSSVYDYFNDIYGIEEELITDLVVAGKCLITTKEQLYNYIEIALRFWNSRINQNKIKEYLGDTIKDYLNTLEDINKIIKVGTK